MIAVPFKHFLIFTDRVRRGVFQLDLDLKKYRRIPIYGHGYPDGISLDLANRKVYWTDSHYTHMVVGCLNATCASILKGFVGMVIVFLKIGNTKLPLILGVVHKRQH